MSYLFDVVLENFFEVSSLVKQQQVESPRPAKVGDKNRVNRHRREERLPRRSPERRLRNLQCRRAERLVDIKQFLKEKKKNEVDLFYGLFVNA